jgi:hypothetical protein
MEKADREWLIPAADHSPATESPLFTACKPEACPLRGRSVAFLLACINVWAQLRLSPAAPIKSRMVGSASLLLTRLVKTAHFMSWSWRLACQACIIRA